MWCTQKAMGMLFDCDRSVVTKHLKNIFDSGELNESAVCAKFAHTASDGKNYMTQFYNLDAVISVAIVSIAFVLRKTDRHLCHKHGL